MINYSPDNWVVLRLKGDDPHYRILGGYLDGSSWRLNSSVVKVEEDDTHFIFYGSSGSAYICGKNSYGLKMNTAYVWVQLQDIHEDKIEMMSGDTDWSKVDWIIK